MFSYDNRKPSFFEKVKIIWNYVRTGKMHADQIILTVDEAKKLASFINDNIKIN